MKQERCAMKKIKNMSESSFLKLVFGFLTLAFLVAAFCMPDRSQMLSGLAMIITQPSKVSTNYFAVGGFAATFLNMALVGMICLLLYCLPGAVHQTHRGSLFRSFRQGSR